MQELRCVVTTRHEESSCYVCLSRGYRSLILERFRYELYIRNESEATKLNIMIYYSDLLQIASLTNLSRPRSIIEEQKEALLKSGIQAEIYRGYEPNRVTSNFSNCRTTTSSLFCEFRITSTADRTLLKLIVIQMRLSHLSKNA